MKYLKSAVCILLVCIMLSGCNFRISSSIDDLISPLSPFGDNADIKNALDEYLKNGYSLKTPGTGKYITSYSFFDLNDDGTDEAIAFYEPSDNLGTINMAVIGKTDSEWQVLINIKGEGKDISSLDFIDINSDSREEIFVCWDAISNSSNHQLCVYSYSDNKGKVELKKIDESITVNNYIAVDLLNDETPELLLFEINSGSSSSAKAELYSLKGNFFRLLGETRLDSHITSYQNIKIEKAENDTRVYADAIGSDGESMLTEIIYWSNGYNTIISPFFSYSTGLTSGTSRNSMLQSADVNGDGLIEVPVDYTVKKLPDEVRAIDWKIYKNTILIHKNYSLFAKNDRYTVLIPDDIIKEISVEYNQKTREMTVLNRESKKTVFSVIPVLKGIYSEEDYQGYEVVLEASGYYYIARQGDDEEIVISAEQLKENIKSVS